MAMLKAVDPALMQFRRASLLMYYLLKVFISCQKAIHHLMNKHLRQQLMFASLLELSRLQNRR